MSRRQIAAIAAATAFWFFLSLAPMVILAVSVLPYTSLTEAQVLAAVAPVFPASVTELIQRILADIYSTGPGVLSLSAAVTLWSSARGFSALIRGLELIQDVPRHSGYLRRRFRGMLCTLIMLFALILSIVLGGFGRQLAALVERFLPETRGLFAFLLHFRFLVVVLALTLFFAAIFRLSAAPRSRPRDLLPGALLSAGGWSLFSWAFSAWVSATGSFGAYGSLATVAVVMLWLYYCQYILLLGACFNRSLPKLWKD